MEKNLDNTPGVIMCNGKSYKTSKVKKYIEKNNFTNYEVFYIEDPSSDFKILNQQLQALENQCLGLSTVFKDKPKPDEQRPYPFTYRVNVNTILCAYNEDDLNKLKSLYNIK